MIGTYLTSTFFLLIVLGLFLMRANSHFDVSVNRKKIVMLICSTAFYVLMDGLFIACDLDTHSGLTFFRIIVFLFYISYVLLPFCWHIFVRSYIGIDYNRVIKIVETIPLVILLSLVALSPFTGCLWTIQADRTYVRGEYFTFFSILNYFYYAEPFADAFLSLFKKRIEERKYILQAIIISMVPIVSAIGNNFFIPIYQIYPFQPFCQVLVVILGFFFLANRQDTDERKKHSIELEKAIGIANEERIKAEKANKVKTTFLSTVSHDIRTPMNAIVNLSKLAYTEDDTETIHRYLEKIIVSSDFLLGLINDILDMSRIESGNLVLNKERLTRSEFLTSVETVINPLMEAKNINFHSELRPGAYTILVDKLRFNQIFFNLLSNAVKFTPEGGDVWFEVWNNKLVNDELEIVFTVRDNGIGMSKEFQEHLFEPFMREDNSETRKTPGTGLGLSIVKSLVDAMDGTIKVSSELGKGTEFVVTFKAQIACEDASSEAVATIAPSSDLKGLKVLLVEDNELNVYVASLILENMGCIITTAENGKAGVETFEKSEINYFDVILMDVRMPVMDGIEATKTIRSLDRADAKTVPIVAMTADVFDENVKETLEAGMNLHLTKPVELSKLTEALNECVAMSKAR